MNKVTENRNQFLEYFGASEWAIYSFWFAFKQNFNDGNIKLLLCVAIYNI